MGNRISFERTGRIKMLIVCIVLSVVCFILIFYICILKKQADIIGKELKATRQDDYNRQLKITLIDNDLEKMTSEINNNLDYQKMLKLEADKSRRQLKQSVSDIAHDLRTPLTVVKGNLFMLSKEQGLSEHGRESLRISMEKTDALKEMVDDFFELSVLESDLSSAELKKIDATTFIAQFVIDNETVIRQHGLTPKLILPEKSVFVRADEMLITRMFNNLLNNVLKYAKEGFVLKLLENSHENDTVRISFSNKIDRENDFDAEKLFERTYRGNLARPSGGAGLGLYIVKLLAEKQGAAVSANIEEDNLEINIDFKKED